MMITRSRTKLLDEVALGDSPLEPEKEGIDPGGLKMDDYDE